jgi:hypothetical protein
MEIRSNEQSVKAMHILGALTKTQLTGDKNTTWMDYVINMCNLLRKAPWCRRVKIAVIDDGVDISLPILCGRVKAEKSSSLDGSTTLMSPYYVPSSRYVRIS